MSITCAETDTGCGSGGHFCIKRGGTKTLTFRYQDKTGAPIDITGLQARLRFATALTDPPVAVLTLTSSPAAGLTITDPTQGTVAAKLTPTQTLALASGVKLEWQFELYNPLDVSIVHKFPPGTADVTDPVP